MSQSKIEIKLGAFHFLGEGERAWVTGQLDKVIRNANSLQKKKGSTKAIADVSRAAKSINAGRGKSTAKTAATAAAGSGNELAAFIMSKKDAATNQRKKFLATAAWLGKKNKKVFVTRDITKALKKTRFSKIVNPSQYMAQNIKMGLIKKSGSGFSLTPKGSSSV